MIALALCPICGLQIHAALGMCLHHTAQAEGPDWHVGNRAWCDFAHRGIVGKGEETT